MKIYVCYWTDYDGINIEKIFTNETQAIIFAAIHSSCIDVFDVDDNMYDVNDYHLFKYFKIGYNVANGENPIVEITEHTGVEGYTNTTNDNFNVVFEVNGTKVNGVMFAIIKANSQDKATKIFFDRYTPLYNKYQQKIVDKES